MKLNDIPKEILAELFSYLADHESFETVKGLGTFSPDEVTALFKELAKLFSEQANEEVSSSKPQLNEAELSDKAQTIISCLTPKEELILFRSFKLMDR